MSSNSAVPIHIFQSTSLLTCETIQIPLRNKYHHLWVTFQHNMTPRTCHIQEKVPVLNCAQERTGNWVTDPFMDPVRIDFNWDWLQSWKSRQWFQQYLTILLNLETGVPWVSVPPRDWSQAKCENNTTHTSHQEKMFQLEHKWVPTNGSNLTMTLGLFLPMRQFNNRE